MRKKAAVLAAAFVLISAAPRTEAAPIDRIPGDASVAFVIDDTAALYNKGMQLPTAKTILACMDDPSFTGSLDYQEFQLERQKLAAELGYPVSGEEFMVNIFENMVIYSSSMEEMQDGVLSCALGVKDQAKAQKLIDVLVKRANAKAAEAAVNGAPVQSVETLDIAGVTVLHNPVGATSEPTMALGEGVLYITGSVDAMRAMLEPAPGVASLAGSATYKKLAALTGKGEMNFWFDGKDMNSMGGMTLQLPNMPETMLTLASISLEPNGVSATAANSFSTTALYPSMKPGPLPTLKSITPNALLAMSSHKFDSEMIVGMLKQLMEFQASFSPGAAGASPLQAFENATGISVDNELTPALGNEIAFAINNIQASPASMIPQVDIGFAVAVRDAGKAHAVMGKFEKYLENQTASMAMPGPGGTPQGPVFADSTAGGVPCRSLTLPMMPMFSPAYCFKDDILYVALSVESLGSAMTRSAGQQVSATGSDAYAEMVRRTGSDHLYTYTCMDMNSLKSLVLMYLPMLGMQMPTLDQQQAQTVLSQVLGSISYAAFTEYSSGDSDMSKTWIQMQ